MVVNCRHSESIDRFSFEIEFHQHCWLVSHYPPIVPGLDGDYLRSYKLQRAAVLVLNMDLPARKEAHVGVHAEVGADDRFHASRPTESRRVDYTLNAAVAGAYDVELEAANVAVFALVERSEEWIKVIHEILRVKLHESIRVRQDSIKAACPPARTDSRRALTKSLDPASPHDLTGIPSRLA